MRAKGAFLLPWIVALSPAVVLKSLLTPLCSFLGLLETVCRWYKVRRTIPATRRRCLRHKSGNSHLETFTNFHAETYPRLGRG
jgi:hypothetical protein